MIITDVGAAFGGFDENERIVVGWLPVRLMPRYIYSMDHAFASVSPCFAVKIQDHITTSTHR